MSRFDRVIMVDWSGGKDRGPTPKKDAIWLCSAAQGRVDPPEYMRNRVVAEARLRALIEQSLRAGERLFIGFDFAFGYPMGVARALCGSDDARDVWALFDAQISDMKDGSDRGQLAAQLNGGFAGEGPFWFNPFPDDIQGLPRQKPGSPACPQNRRVETLAKGSFSVWQLGGAGSVGSQTLMGMGMLHRLRRDFPASVWPFESAEQQVVVAEIWPSLIADHIASRQKRGEIKDAAQVRVLAQVVSGLTAEQMGGILASPEPVASEEGWIFGLGHEDILTPSGPPPLSNDCFALPAGVHWAPVDQALSLLKERLPLRVDMETCPSDQAHGRILSQDVRASRANPPAANSAVDGYGFAGGAQEGVQTLPLVDGRAAAGGAFEGIVPKGHAIRILTGAVLPQGVDTVILQEDVTASAGSITFRGPLKTGANCRRAGEDVDQGALILGKSRRVTIADVALLSATGVAEVEVYRPLRVAVMSTGDELGPPDPDAPATQTFDANRPMLLAMARHWGCETVDLGVIGDTGAAIRAALGRGAAQADVILTSGGASAGDEDHISAALNQAGGMALWRIALKPGRPLALGLWEGTPVFGLPGNPVAALVCALVFARPALLQMAGGQFETPRAMTYPAAFSKHKKSGRSEYLRARLRDGQVEVFASEGSGRISGLSWAEGLVALGPEACEITQGTPVSFIPFESFGL